MTRDQTFTRWLELIRARETKHGPYHPVAWSDLVYGILDAINAGERVWPVYAKLKHGAIDPRPKTYVLGTAGLVEVPPSPGPSKRLVRALALAILDADPSRARRR